MRPVDLDDATLAEIEGIARPYMWWSASDGAAHATDRLIAQIMRFGRYEDIRSLERRITAERLLLVMQSASPGWFDRRSWDFWRGRLAAEGLTGLSAGPPERDFLSA